MAFVRYERAWPWFSWVPHSRRTTFDLKRGSRHEGSVGDGIPSSSEYMADRNGFGDFEGTVLCLSLESYHRYSTSDKKRCDGDGTGTANLKGDFLSVVEATPTPAALKENEMTAATENVLADKAVWVTITHKAYRKSPI